MCRRFYFPIPILDIIGEAPNTKAGRQTNSALNATLAKQPTIVENYRNLGADDVPLTHVLMAKWRGFKLRAVPADHAIPNTYHATILKAVSQQVVASAIAAYRSVKP